MIDGKEIPLSAKTIAPIELSMLGWKLFILPKKSRDIIFWASNNLLSWNNFVGINVIAIRRHEDAVLFKLSWPECNQRPPDAQMDGTMFQQRENIGRAAKPRGVRI